MSIDNTKNAAVAVTALLNFFCGCPGAGRAAPNLACQWGTSAQPQQQTGHGTAPHRPSWRSLTPDPRPAPIADTDSVRSSSRTSGKGEGARGGMSPGGKGGRGGGPERLFPVGPDCRAALFADTEWVHSSSRKVSKGEGVWGGKSPGRKQGRGWGAYEWVS